MFIDGNQNYKAKSHRPMVSREQLDLLSSMHEEEIIVDSKAKRGVQDRTRINLGEDYEVRYWSERFGVSRDELKSAVKAVGEGFRR